MKRIIRYSDFGPLEITDYEEFLRSSKEQFESVWLRKPNYNEKLSDFEMVEMLGQGTFGEVVLVLNKFSQRHRFHAMKIIEKKRVVEKKQIENTRTEKNILQSLNHPLIVRLDYFFHDNSYLYFIMPHIAGGELFIHLKKMGKFEEDQSRFYAAQVVLALEYLHYINFIHRDIKPENILLDHMGYIKLGDFGFCKRLDKGRTYTLCGTPEYMAPEIVMHKGYGFAADWWAVGVLLFEFHTGMSPFFSRNTTKIFKKIVTSAYKMPPYFSSELKDIVNNLLQDNISKRYGNLKNGVEDIKQHRWFRSVSWLGILSRKIAAPYKPLVKKPSSKSSRNTQNNFKMFLTIAEEDKYKHVFENF